MESKPNFLILCAGKGKRMRPLSDIVPKPLLPFNGRPLLHWTISAIEKMNFNKLGIVVNTLSREIVNDYLNLEFSHLHIELFLQEKLNGIVTAILSASEFHNKPLIAMAGDTVFKLDELRSFYYEFISGKSNIVLGVKERPKEEILRRSNIVVKNEDTMIVEKTLEKPSIDEIVGNLSGVPIWGFKTDAWIYLHNTRISARGEFDITGTVSLALNQNEQVIAVEMNDSDDLTFPIDILLNNFPYLSKLVNSREDSAINGKDKFSF